VLDRRYAHAALLAQPEGVVPEEVERDAATERHGRDRPQRLSDVGQSLLDAEGGEDYARHHRKVQVAVGLEC
jgi:hypothetical protein